MPKTCLHCKNPVFGGKCCKYHQSLRTDKKLKKLKKVSAKQKARNDQYSAELPGWREANPFCVYPNCNRPTEECHHVIGRGIHTNNKDFMLPLCHEHHDICKSDPKLAFELNLIQTRAISRKNLYD